MIVLCIAAFHCLPVHLCFCLFWSLVRVEGFPQLSVILGRLNALGGLTNHQFYCGVPG